MNGKQAKRLRRAAVGLAVHLSETGKDIKKDGYQVKMHQRTNALKMNEEGVLESTPRPPSPQAIIRPDSLKGIYKQLKKSVA